MRAWKTSHLILISTVAFLATLACLALLIANISKVQLGEGGESIAPTVNKIVPIAIDILIGIGICVFAIVIFRLLTRGRPQRVALPAPRSSILTWVVILVILVSILVVVQITNLQTNPTDNGTPADPQQTGNATAGRNDLWTSYAPMTAIVGVLLVVILVSIFLALRSSRNGGFGGMRFPPTEAKPETGAVIDAAIEDLKTSDDARGAIIRIYAQMCRLMRKGPDERKTLTPRELKALAVGGYGWPEEPVSVLTEIFEEARYSDHQISDESRTVALSCLDRIKGSLPTQKGGAAVA